MSDELGGEPAPSSEQPTEMKIPTKDALAGKEKQGVTPARLALAFFAILGAIASIIGIYQFSSATTASLKVSAYASKLPNIFDGETGPIPATSFDEISYLERCKDFIREELDITGDRIEYKSKKGYDSVNFTHLMCSTFVGAILDEFKQKISSFFEYLSSNGGIRLIIQNDGDLSAENVTITISGTKKVYLVSGDKNIEITFSGNNIDVGAILPNQKIEYFVITDRGQFYSSLPVVKNEIIVGSTNTQAYVSLDILGNGPFETLEPYLIYIFAMGFLALIGLFVVIAGVAQGISAIARGV